MRLGSAISSKERCGIREVLARIGKWESELGVMVRDGKRRAGWAQMDLREVLVGERNGK